MLARIGTPLALLGALLVASAPEALAAGKVRIAFGDIATVESLHFLAALERAKERGVQPEITYFKSEDLAAQAVVSGQADIGVGTPYALIQKVRAPIRVFTQLQKLRFYPVVNTAFYRTWKDLDGEEIVVHSRGSGTEAIMKLMADKHGIKYRNISYVPGSEVRAGALLQGNIKATVLDAANRRLVMQKAPGKFAVLPLEGIDASDEALYANEAFLTREAATVDALVQSILTTWRDLVANPAIVTEWRQKYNLLPDLPKDLEKEIGPYFKEAVEAGIFPVNGGGREAARDDLAFYSLAGQLQGDPATLKPESFWAFGPLDRALEKVGRK